MTKPNQNILEEFDREMPHKKDCPLGKYGLGSCLCNDTLIYETRKLGRDKILKALSQQKAELVKEIIKELREKYQWSPKDNTSGFTATYGIELDDLISILNKYK